MRWKLHIFPACNLKQMWATYLSKLSFGLWQVITDITPCISRGTAAAVECPLQAAYREGAALRGCIAVSLNWICLFFLHFSLVARRLAITLKTNPLYMWLGEYKRTMFWILSFFWPLWQSFIIGKNLDLVFIIEYHYCGSTYHGIISLTQQFRGRSL